MGQTPTQIASDVALAWRTTTWNERALVARAEKLLGRRPRWVRPVARSLLVAYPDAAPADPGEIEVAILGDPRFRRARHRRSLGGRVVAWFKDTVADLRGRPQRWDTPPIANEGALAQWLDLPAKQLDWLADPGWWEARTGEPRLLNYRYRWLRKRTGAWRLIEIPKPRLRALQRKLLDDIVAKIPAHDAAHGFRPGRSIKTFVAPHVAARVVIRIDLADFFPSISAGRVRAIFRAAGYRRSVARLLAGLCTNATAGEVFRALPGETPPQIVTDARRLYGVPHLPQGAPTSPALANLAAWRLDKRLAGLAHKLGANYTRYADDLLFSGDEQLARRARRVVIHVAAIAMEEGFSVAFRKTRVMRRAARQHAAGLVINRHPNVRRRDYDRLKATLHNCVRFGPATQNRAGRPHFRAHLTGRVAFVEQINPQRGQRLRAILNRIQWP